VELCLYLEEAGLHIKQDIVILETNQISIPLKKN